MLYFETRGTYLCLPFGLGRRAVCAKAVDVVSMLGETWEAIAEPAGLGGAASCAQCQTKFTGK